MSNSKLPQLVKLDLEDLIQFIEELVLAGLLYVFYEHVLRRILPWLPSLPFPAFIGGTVTTNHLSNGKFIEGAEDLFVNISDR